VLDTNPKKVKIVFKNLPLPMHKMAQPAALAAIAALNQGKFWQMHDKLFETRPLSEKSIQDAAVAIGLDMEKFKKDLASPATRQRLSKDMLAARKAGVSGTPTLFVNGQRVMDRRLPAIQAMINQAVGKEK